MVLDKISSAGASYSFGYKSDQSLHYLPVIFLWNTKHKGE